MCFHTNRSNSFNCSNVKFVRERLCLLLTILLPFELELFALADWFEPIIALAIDAANDDCDTPSCFVSSFDDFISCTFWPFELLSLSFSSTSNGCLCFRILESLSVKQEKTCDKFRWKKIYFSSEKIFSSKKKNDFEDGDCCYWMKWFESLHQHSIKRT